ncbi:unnamed protein product [Dovyalis caffra]|uniref:Uncharacterized protein n=1 Tax=Dovyalis caffra TaxID=77055 RepID=A0AAV1QSV3_9ROSI|nr:unnamed protein product [Dovyalis caffra]
MKKLFSKLSNTKVKPYVNVGCQKCAACVSEIVDLTAKLTAKDTHITLLNRMLALKEEEISRLKDQQYLTDKKLNKLWADVEFVWKEFEQVKINEDEEGSDNCDGKLNKSEKQKTPANRDGRPQSPALLPHIYKKPPSFPVLKGDSPPPMEQNIPEAAPSSHISTPSNHDRAPPPPTKNIKMENNSGAPPTEELIVMAGPINHDLSPDQCVPTFRDDLPPSTEEKFTVTAPSSHAEVTPYVNVGCQKCTALVSEIVDRTSKLTAKGIHITRLNRMLVLKDEKISRLEDQQYLADTKINKLRADVELVWKEFEQVKIHEDEEGSDNCDGKLNKSEKQKTPANRDGRPQSPALLPRIYKKPPSFPVLKGDSPPPMEQNNIPEAAPSSHGSTPPKEENIMVAAPSNHDRAPPPPKKNIKVENNSGAPPTEELIVMAGPISHDLSPRYVPTFRDDLPPNREEKFTVTTPSSHAKVIANEDGKLQSSLHGFQRPPTPIPYYRVYVPRKRKKNKNIII